MKKYSVTSTAELRKLCIKNNWFTSGSIEQYDKLFYANENGCPIEEIATIIWLCSDEDCRRADILDVLVETHRQHILNVIHMNGDKEKLLHQSVEDVYNSYFD